MDFLNIFVEFCNLSTILVCLVFKIPQIVTIIKSQSVAGVSTSSVLAELLTYTINLAYNFSQGYHLATYFEYYFCVIQDIVLTFILFHYSGTLDFLKIGGMGLFISGFCSLAIGIPSPAIIVFLIKCAGAIGATSKTLQLQKLLTTKDSQNVSLLTWSIAAYTASARIITTLMLTGDIAILVNYSIAAVLNLLIIATTIYYRRPPAPPTPELVAQDVNQDKQKTIDKKK